MSGNLWVGYLLVHAQSCKEQSAAVYFFSFHVIVKYVGDAAGVPVSLGDKTCRSSLDHFNLVILVSLVRTPDSRTVVQV